MPFAGGFVRGSVGGYAAKTRPPSPIRSSRSALQLCACGDVILDMRFESAAVKQRGYSCYIRPETRIFVRRSAVGPRANGHGNAPGPGLRLALRCSRGVRAGPTAAAVRVARLAPGARAQGRAPRGGVDVQSITSVQLKIANPRGGVKTITKTAN